MSTVAAPAARPQVDDCWNRIGVRGDRSCDALKEHAHCGNCPVQHRSAAHLLEAPAPDDYLAEWTRHCAEPPPREERSAKSFLIFRVANEWLALSAAVIAEVTNPKPIHSLPHRRNGVVLGVTNVRGELLVCASLPRVLGLAEAVAGPGAQRDRTAFPRFIVVRYRDLRAVFPVDEVHGIHRPGARALADVPATIGKASTAHSTKLLAWQDRSVGVLDENLLASTLKRRFA